ncbi:MAG: DUF6290 family protein [Lachnospiraceae bacterium]|nr:DUF6290 family protein [Lachnospiraceae bacterium]
MTDRVKQMGIRVALDEYKLMQEYANFQGKPLSAIILDLIREEMENWEDERDIKEIVNRKESSISFQEVVRKAGI